MVEVINHGYLDLGKHPIHLDQVFLFILKVTKELNLLIIFYPAPVEEMLIKLSQS